MINNLTVLAFIPARGGSKRLSNKNILKLKCKELISYTIEAAVNSEICDEIMVSTDNDKIAELSKKYGANVPFMRPKLLAHDDSKMMDVIMHTINWYEKRKKTYDLFLYLQPTSPLRNAKHVLEAFKIFFKKDADIIISVNKSKSIPQKMNTLPEDLSMKNFISRNIHCKNRQEFVPYYELNGAIHIAKWDVLKDSKSWFTNKCFAYLMEEPYCLDIDTQLDFDFAEFILNRERSRQYD